MAGFPISFLDPAELSDIGGAASGVAGLSNLIPGIGTLLSLGLSLADIFGLFGGGVPKGAKTSGAASALQSEGGIAGELGAGINALGGGQGSNVLSNPAFAHETNSLADELTWLSGKALPGWKPMGTTGEIANLPPPSGAPYSKGVNIMGVQSPEQMAAILGKSPNLTPEQIQTILPQLINLAKSPGSVASMKGAIDPLVTSAEKTPTGVPLGSITDFMNQGHGQSDNPQSPLPWEILSTLLGGGSLLSSLFDRGGSNSDTTNSTTNNSTTNNIMAALGLPGAALKQPQPTAPRFTPMPAMALPVA